MAVTFKFGANISDFNKKLAEMRAKAKEARGDVEDINKSTQGVMGKLGGLARGFGTAFSVIAKGAAGAAAAVAAVGAAAFASAKAEAGMGTLEKRLTAITGNAGEVAEALEKLEKFALWQGVDDEPLARGAEKLMQAGMSLKDAFRTMQNISIISAGTENAEATQATLRDLIARAQAGEGLGTRELGQFERQGLDLRSALADVLGTQRSEVENLVKDALPVDVLLAALEELKNKRAEVNEAERQGLDAALRRTKFAWDTVTGEIGVAIMEGLTGGTNDLAATLMSLRPLFKQVGEWLAEAIKWTSGFANALIGGLDTVKTAVISIFTVIVDAGYKLIAELGKKLDEWTGGLVGWQLEDRGWFDVTSALWSEWQARQNKREMRAERAGRLISGSGEQNMVGDATTATSTPAPKIDKAATNSAAEIAKAAQKRAEARAALDETNAITRARMSGNTALVTRLEYERDVKNKTRELVTAGLSEDEARQRAEEAVGLQYLERADSQKGVTNFSRGTTFASSLNSIGGGGMFMRVGATTNPQTVIAKQQLEVLNNISEKLTDLITKEKGDIYISSVFSPDIQLVK